jgi:hypothetical protein
MSKINMLYGQFQELIALETFVIVLYNETGSVEFQNEIISLLKCF